MIFLHNKKLIYPSLLRNYIQNSVIKNGFKYKHIENLRKIYNFEALFSEEIIPINLNNYLNILFTAILIRKKELKENFDFLIYFRNNCMINLKTFTALIMNLCSKAEFIKIYSFNGNLIIKTDKTITKHSLKLIKKLKGCAYYEIKTRKFFIKIPITATDKKTVSINKNIEEYILNPFSIVNIFI